MSAGKHATSNNRTSSLRAASNLVLPSTFSCAATVPPASVSMASVKSFKSRWSCSAGGTDVCSCSNSVAASVLLSRCRPPLDAPSPFAVSDAACSLA